MSEGEKATANETPVSGNLVKFFHILAPSFRSVHADGVWGALSSYGNIHLSFFNERPNPPQFITQEFGPDGQWLPKEPKYEYGTNANWVRQFEVEVILSVESAKVMRQVLHNFIDLAEQGKKGPPPSK